MALVMLAGYCAFILASLALGAKLLLLARRTHEFPELAIGLSFLFGGGLGYIAWFALAMLGPDGDPVLTHRVATCGLAFTNLGALFAGLGTHRIFRPDRRWPIAYIGAVATVFAIALVGAATAQPGSNSDWFWVGLVSTVALYGWGALEAWWMTSVLHKRARLGLAEPEVVNRTRQWGRAMDCVVAMILISFAMRMVYGNDATPQWISLLVSLFGVACAGAIWLGFFPPSWWRARLVREYAS